MLSAAVRRLVEARSADTAIDDIAELADDRVAIVEHRDALVRAALVCFSQSVPCICILT
jgi:hypothetical protein